MSFVDLVFLTRVIRCHENWENLINASVPGVTWSDMHPQVAS
jgi:hypothetical protein